MIDLALLEVGGTEYWHGFKKKRGLKLQAPEKSSAERRLLVAIVIRIVLLVLLVLVTLFAFLIRIFLVFVILIA